MYKGQNVVVLFSQCKKTKKNTNTKDLLVSVHNLIRV